jgi:hypothetical protein
LGYALFHAVGFKRICGFFACSRGLRRVDARRRLLHTVRSATALASLCVGDEVRINQAVSPRYLAGLQGTVIGVDDHAATVRLPGPVGRFSTGQVRCPPLALDKIAGVVA